LILRVRQKSAGGHGYARSNTGANITRANNENGALPIRELEEGEQRNKKPPRDEA
jgi:hypothetical protein